MKRNSLLFIVLMQTLVLCCLTNKNHKTKDFVYYFQSESSKEPYEKRVYINDSVFYVELFSLDMVSQFCCDTFMLKNGKMSYFYYGQFYPLFSKEAFLKKGLIYKKTKSKLGGDFPPLIYTPDSLLINGQDSIYGFKELTQETCFECPCTHYFDPKIGIVRIDCRRDPPFFMKIKDKK
jgi:hypothetical protein